MCPSNPKIGHDDEEDEEDEIKLSPGEARNSESDPESLSPPVPEPSEAIEVNSDGRRALDRLCPDVCGSRKELSTDPVACVDGGVGGRTTTRGPFEVRTVTLNTFRAKAHESACSITLDFNGLRNKWVTTGC